MSAEIADTIAQLCVIGPVMFAGLMMLIDPTVVVDLLWSLMDGIHRFRGSLVNRQWFGGFPEPRAMRDPAAANAFIRGVGVLLILLALGGVVSLALSGR